jgi:hypothetical protein
LLGPICSKNYYCCDKGTFLIRMMSMLWLEWFLCSASPNT